MSSLFKYLVPGLVLFYILVSIDFDVSARRLGILHQPAPSWGVAEWVQLPEGKVTLDVDDFKGKVLYFMKRMPSGLLMASSHPVNHLRQGD